MSSKPYPSLLISTNADETITKVSELVANIANDSIDKKEKFVVALSGGSVANVLNKGLPHIRTDWRRWHVFFCDERHVSLSHTDSNYAAYKDGLFSKVDIPANQIYTIQANRSVHEAADLYQKEIQNFFPTMKEPVFDLLILGMGPDGHTCSLFPNHKLLQEKARLVAAVTDSPKPPAERITLTLPVIQLARHSAFICTGKQKAEVVQRIVSNEISEAIPASLVRPVDGDVTWFLDTDSASLLNN